MLLEYVSGVCNIPLVSVFYLDPYNSSTAKALLHLWDPGLTLLHQLRVAPFHPPHLSEASPCSAAVG